MDELQATIHHHLTRALGSQTAKPRFPLSSQELLCFLISSSPSPIPGLQRLRLPDLPRFEQILEYFALSCESFVIALKRDNIGLSIIDIRLADTKTRRNSTNTSSRKRKRNDEDDSAEEEDVEEEAQQPFGHSTSFLYGLSGLTKDLQEAYALLQRPTARGRLLAEQYRSTSGSFEPICPMITKDECARSRRDDEALHMASICDKVHFRAIIRAHTDPNLGHCSYLNTCYSEPSYAFSPSIPPVPTRLPGQQGQQGRFPQPDVGRGPSSLPNGLGAGGRGKEKAPCRYLHFEVDWDGGDGGELNHRKMTEVKACNLGLGSLLGKDSQPLPPQWINCDIRRFDYSVLGKFHVIMADPPWDIHMSLPYGTMTDDEMRSMPIPSLQDEGLLFLWVTGRAMEVGRECLRVWGYNRIDEVIWMKTNQLQRIIRTGRTGHWLNHTKEHMLVGLKSSSTLLGEPIWPKWLNRGLDTDVIVSEVRETSRKPEEVYSLIERMCPGGRKVEIFGRKHNARPGWLTLGNQLGSDQIHEEELAARIRARYPERMKE